MKKTVRVFAAAFLSLSIIVAMLWLGRRPLLETLINASMADFFKGSVRLSSAEFDSHLRLSLKGISGNFQAKSGIVALQSREIKTLDSLLYLLAAKPVRFVMDGLRPLASMQEGIRARGSYRAGIHWRFEMEADILGVGLQDLVALSPENLAESTGTLQGTLHFATDARQDPAFGLILRAPEPGGRVHAHFFDMLLPYLPQAAVQAKVKEISAGATRLVSYRDADFHMNLETPDHMKLFLHILVPEYNMDLNINMQVHVDKKNSFFQIAQMLGLIQVS
ncbi:MAG TPA: hypothetical protein VL688_05685 [Verrucomicrobiae bacterium]|nr:hypothetical protein [Verrucomicrobiae bacterium]